MLELYHFKNSICSERARMVLDEKGVEDWVNHHVDLFKGEQFSDSYKALNPKAQTPTLVHNGQVIRESSIICDYIDQVFDGPALKPTDPVTLAQMREWIKTSDEQLYETVAALSFATIFARTFKDKGAAEKEAHFRSQTDLGRVMRQRSCVEDGFASPYVVRGVNNVMKLMDEMEAVLKDGRTWLMGDQFTLAEINYTPFLARIEALDLFAPFLEGHAHVQNWWDRCKARASYVKAEVGPAQGAEARRYQDSGSACRDQLEALMERIRTTQAYDLTG